MFEIGVRKGVLIATVLWGNNGVCIFDTVSVGSNLEFRPDLFYIRMHINELSGKFGIA